MKKRMLLALVMLSLVIFAGCGKEEAAVSDKNGSKTESSTGKEEQEIPKAQAGIADAEGVEFDQTESMEPEKTENVESVTSEEENTDAAVEDVKGETSKNTESENTESENTESEKAESEKEEPKKEKPEKEGTKEEGTGTPAAPSQGKEETGLVEPEGPKSENQDEKPEPTPSTKDENKDAETEEMTYEEFQAMSPAEQQKYMESFGDIAVFFEWYNRVKTEYEKEHPPIILDGNEIDLGDYLGGE